MKQIIIVGLIAILMIGLVSCSNRDVDKKIQETTKTTTKTKIKKDNSFAAVFSGIALNESDQKLELEKNEKYLKNKYNKDYFIYSNGELLEKKKGIIESRGLDYYWSLILNGYNGFKRTYIAISEDVNLYPREIVNEVSINDSVIKKINQENSVEVIFKEGLTVDLDGDNTLEKIILVTNKNDFSASVLLDSNNDIISYLLITDIELTKLHCQIADVNQDGVMEIYHSMPIYEGFDFRVYEYKNQNFSGEYKNISNPNA